MRGKRNHISYKEDFRQSIKPINNFGEGSAQQGWGTRTQYSYSQYSSTEFLVLIMYSYSWELKW